MKMSILFILVFAAGLGLNIPFGALADQIELKLLQPNRVFGYEQLVPFRLVVSGQEGGPAENILILRDINRNFKTIQPALEQSQKRNAITGADQIIDGYWKIFEARARHMGVTPEYQNPDFSPLAYRKIVGQHIYDDENIESNIKIKREDRNPVQDYLMEQMGMETIQAFYLYHVCQYGYRQNGLEGAKLAFRDFFARKLDSVVLRFAYRALEFAEVKQMEAILSFGDVNQMIIGDSAIESFVGPLVEEFFNGVENSNSVMVANIIRDSGVDSTDKEAVRRMLIQAFTPLLDPETSDVSYLLMGQKGRIQNGIIAEKEGGKLHALGPKSLQRKLNTDFIEIIRLQTYMGIQFSQAYEFANFLATNHEYIISYSDEHHSNQYQGIYSWLKTDFEAGARREVPAKESICSALLRRDGRIQK